MTRINSAIPVKNLTDEHLLAEHREIIRITTIFNRSSAKTINSKIPKEFCLGTGHVTFFLNKLGFIFTRYTLLYEECKRRGFYVKYYGDNWFTNKAMIDFWFGYRPTQKEKKMLEERITDRILNSKKEYFHYYGKQITKQEAIKLLTQ